MIRFLSLLALTAGLALPAAAQEVTLRFQHFVSPKSANPKYFIEPWAKKVEEESDGRIKVGDLSLHAAWRQTHRAVRPDSRWRD